MRQPLFALLINRGGAQHALHELGRDLDAGTLDGATARVLSDGKLLVERSGTASEVAIHTGVDESRDALLISGSLESPEQLGISWEVLILLSLLRRGAVWISTYSEGDLAHLGFVPTLVLQGKHGRVLTADQFDRMLP